MADLTIVKDGKTLVIEKAGVTLVIRTVTLAGSAGAGEGWIYIEDVVVPGGTATSKTYQDAGNTVLQSAVVSSATCNLLVRASYPLVTVGAVTTTLSRAAGGGHYAGAVPVVLTTPTANVRVTVTPPDGGNGAYDTCALTVTAPASILTLAFSGGYPGAQTELKAGDTFVLIGTTSKAIDAVDILDFGAMQANLRVVVAGTSFSVAGVVADRGTTVQSLAARVRVRDAVTGAYSAVRDTNQAGGTVDGVDLVKVNNLYPTVQWGATTYPGAQRALKASETATVVLATTASDTIAITSPNGDLSITDPTVIATPKTVQRIAGGYNIATTNLRAVVTRAANAAQATADAVVKIANTPVSITVTNPAARLRSGGNDGTVAQNHTITIGGDQQLLSAPTLVAPLGTWQGGGFAGGPSSWTRALQIHDNDAKGTYSWGALSAVNLAGIVTTAFGGDSQYVVGGFVARNLTFGAYSQSTTMTVAPTTYTKLVAGVFTATNQPAVRTTVQGDVGDLANRFTVLAMGASPTTVWWNDVAAAATNSTGTAQILAVEETV